MTLAETGVELFQERGLLGRDLDGLLGVRCSSASQRSTRVPRPFSLRIFWIVIEETRLPSSASSASWRLQP